MVVNDHDVRKTPGRQGRGEFPACAVRLGAIRDNRHARRKIMQIRKPRDQGRAQIEPRQIFRHAAFIIQTHPLAQKQQKMRKRRRGAQRVAVRIVVSNHKKIIRLTKQARYAVLWLAHAIPFP